MSRWEFCLFALSESHRPATNLAMSTSSQCPETGVTWCFSGSGLRSCGTPRGPFVRGKPQAIGVFGSVSYSYPLRSAHLRRQRSYASIRNALLYSNGHSYGAISVTKGTWHENYGSELGARGTKICCLS